MGGVSLREYARHRGCQLKAVQDAIAAGRLSASLTPDKRIADVDAADAEWLATTHAEKRPLSGPAGLEPSASLGEARARLDAAKADLAELDLAERRGQVIPAADVQARMVAVFSACKTKLLAIPSRARQQDPGLSHSQIALLDSLIREALEDLADGDVDDGDAADVTEEPAP